MLEVVFANGFFFLNIHNYLVKTYTYSLEKLFSIKAQIGNPIKAIQNP